MTDPQQALCDLIAAGLVAVALALATAGLVSPASAQTAPDTPAAAEAPAGGEALDDPESLADCTPGPFGDGGVFEAVGAEDTRVTAVILEFQCGDVLSDGTFIPTGYRVLVEGECDGADCNYPVVIAQAMAQPEMYGANFLFDGMNVALRLQPPRNGSEGVNVLFSARAPGRDAQPERGRYRLR